MLVKSSSYVLHFIVYRPPPSTKNKIQKASFKEDFGELLEISSTMSGKQVISCDFNIHMDKKTDTEYSQLSSLTDSVGLCLACVWIDPYKRTHS